MGTHANGGLRERERAYIHGVQRLERHLSRERMWLCMMRALELQSPWCTPERHHDELKEAQKKLHEDDDRESVRHGPHSSHGKVVVSHQGTLPNDLSAPEPPHAVLLLVYAAKARTRRCPHARGLRRLPVF